MSAGEDEQLTVLLDQHKCIGSGQCVFSAPEVFDQRDSDGIAFLLTEHPDGEHYDEVREAVQVCPAQAIELREG